MITILISTSPRPSHPSTRILDQTILSIRAQLPNAPIIIMADGGGEEKYQDFLYAIKDRYSDCTVIAYKENVQQSGMLETALKLVKTPLVFYLEDDWEIHPGIEWDKLGDIIRSGYCNYIRLYACHRVVPCHEHMMFDRVTAYGVPLIKTSQFSQNPHLASTQFYLDQVLPKCGPRDMIENLMHGPCASAEWEEYKLCIYNPEWNGSMSVITHLDGKNTQ